MPIKNLTKARNDKLGMSFGVAYNDLRKRITYTLASALGLDSCYRCGSHIPFEEFTIEHKESWWNADNPLDKFMDVSNIAFSHKSCNSKAAALPYKKYSSIKDQKRAHNKRYYEKNKFDVNRRRRDARKLKQGVAQLVEF